MDQAGLSAWSPAARSGAYPWSVASARPGAACAAIAGRPVLGGLDAIPGAETGGVRRSVAPRSVAVRLYAVPRRTRRRDDAVRGAAVRGAAGPAAWGRWRAGTACACCAR